ncbi:N-acetylmannosamine-6-phosphate 2-epimerase [Proteiniclasticum sp. SCR006]|uniref:Putative N-acetylmannosamine-6-phosphate 2-epimerase n=1 Tax=Proteiniclasticum aestuarii TaxID=2817862 RepID=A0A939KJH1_9CLOT|nr:N-acetylmannosamine-6-phosphate 2-epimerase [Proteiniclasticum aestuarii]MBO1265153.1 N-acetylmannosamine-6-phosphate 2-epimerase [Proteiniclasticum aestuarii]
MKSKEEILESIKGGLVVSCQALPEEPLHSSYIMGRMAYAAFEGGAIGIRANTVEDIQEIRRTVDLPIIGIIKKVYGDCPVFITPTMVEIDALAEEGVEIIALDATERVRPDGKLIEEVFPEIRRKYPDQIFMADCATYEDAKKAVELGFDCIGSTLAGYTEESKERSLPDFDLIGRMVTDFDVPVIAEGGISTPQELKKVMDLGVHAAVVGSAITRPLEITKKFVSVVK